MTFAELGLNEHILEGVRALGFTTPTPVQAQAIPHVLAGRDVIASAQTGTGKTAAFALPILQIIEEESRAARIEQAEKSARSKAEAATGAEADAEPTDEAAGGPDVLADLADDGSASVSQDAGDGASRPKRRRRRRHKKAPAADGSGERSGSAPKPSGRSGSGRGSRGGRGGRGGRGRGRGGRSRNGGRRAEELKPNPNANPFGPFALVVTPTRELAQQIEDVVSVVCEKTDQKAVVVMGGTKLERQIRELEDGCDLLVATPGRLLDLMEHGHVTLEHVKVFVLDEADRMLDMGFWPSVRRIVSELPRERQTLLFSATIPPSIKGTVDAMLHDPVSVEIARVGETADTVEEHLCPVTQGQKTQLRYLKGAGIAVDVMHADRPQKARERALEKFRDGKVQVLVATDVMSRGIDVSGIDAVINFDVPMDPEDYVHRIGRTGRAGQTGHAYTFVAPDEISPLREIEYFTKKLVPVWDLEGFDYDSGRIVPNPTRSTTKPTRSLFSGSRSRGRGISGGRYGRHY